MLLRVLFSLLEQARMVALGNVVLLVENKSQFRVNKKIFARLSRAGWIRHQHQSGDVIEYALTETGREVAQRLKEHRERFMQLSLWEVEKEVERAEQELQQSLF